MKIRVELSAVLVLGLLFCGLALLEFPELLTLTDDTSNSFTFVSGASLEVAPSPTRGRAPAPKVSIRIAGRHIAEASRGRRLAYAVSAPEALHFFCILRT